MNICIVVSMILGVRAGVDVYDRTCMHTFLCMYVRMYVCMYVNIRVMWVYACVWGGGVGVLVKVFKKQKQKVFFVWYLKWDGDGGAHKKKKKR